MNCANKFAPTSVSFLLNLRERGTKAAIRGRVEHILLLITLTLLSGCSVYDVRQLITPSSTALLIRQEKKRNTLDVSVVDEKFTRLDGVHVEPKQLPVTPSHSLAVETRFTASQPIPVTTLEQAQKTLIQYLAQVEEQPETVEKLIAEAEQLAGRYPDDALLQSLLQRMLRYSDWQPVSSIINSAGIAFANVKGWQPESPFMRTRRALLPPVADDEQVIFGDQRLVLLLTNVAPVTLHVDARLEDVPFLPEAPAQLLFQVDERPTRQLALADKADWRHFTVTIPAGEHSVRFYQQQPVGNQYVKLRFDDAGVMLAVAQERPYFISGTQAPLEFYSQGPSVLRIDELNQGVVSYRYQNVPEGWHKISLPPPAGKPRSLLRVSQRVVNLQPKPLNNRIIQRTLNPVAEPEPVPTPPATTDKVELIDAFKLGKQEDGTLSVGVDFVRRNNVQESESGSNLPEEQFVQHRLSYRYFDEPHDAYWHTLGFFRIREHGYPSFGLDESVYYNPDWLPFTVRSSAKVIAQVVQVPLGQVAHDELAALGQGNLTFAQAYNLHPKTRLIPSLTFFARAMSLNIHTLTGSDPNDPNFKPNTDTLLSDPDFKLNAEKIDQDVYTPYKADHTAGLIPALTLEHRPWLDTIWSTRVAMGTNEDFDLTRPDHYSTEAHWQQLMGSVALDTFYRITFYQADDYSNQQAYPFSPNRNNPSKRSFTGLELNWQHWTAYQNRIEVAAQYTYDIERRANLATVSFTWHFGEGRGYRDFAPNEHNFRDIRQRLRSNEHNNVMRDADPSVR